MNLHELYDLKSDYEDKIFEIDTQISERWKYLVGSGNGTLKSWSLPNSNVYIECEWRGNSYTDIIPQNIFSAEGDENSKLMYNEYLEEKAAKERAEKEKVSLEKQKAEYERLKAIFEVQ